MLKSKVPIRQKYLVFGASGQLGRAFVALKNGASRYEAAPRSLFEASSRAVASYLLSSKVQGVIQCAGYTRVDQAETEVTQAHLINSYIPQKIATVAGSLDLSFIHFSSEAVFSGLTPGPHRETEIPDPISSYGRSKLLGDSLILESNPNCHIFRVSWLYSANTANNFLGRVIPSLQAGRPIAVVGDVMGNPAPVDYVAKMVDMALDKSVAPGLYNLGSRDFASKYQWAVQIASNLGFSPHLVTETRRSDFPTPAPRSGDATLDTTRFEKAAGVKLECWQPLLINFLAKLSP